VSLSSGPLPRGPNRPDHGSHPYVMEVRPSSAMGSSYEFAPPSAIDSKSHIDLNLPDRKSSGKKALLYSGPQPAEVKVGPARESLTLVSNPLGRVLQLLETSFRPFPHWIGHILELKHSLCCRDLLVDPLP
jgi:hypothetical protein